METKKKYKKIVAPLIGTIVTLGTSVASLISSSCDNSQSKPDKPLQKDYQEAIKGPINYVALGDQYASLYNDVDGGWYDYQKNKIYGLSYASYLANFINMMSNKTTRLDSYYNFGLTNTTLSDWLHLLNPSKYQASNETLRHFEFNKTNEKDISIENQNKNSLLFNNFNPSKNGYDFLLNKIKNANLITLSLSFNDFLNESECFDLMWKTLSAEFVGQNTEKVLADLVAKVESRVEQIKQKYNNLLVEIRKLNPKANINLVGYASPFLKLAKLLENKFSNTYISNINSKINDTIESIAKTHKINFVNFDNVNGINKDIKNYSPSFLGQSPNHNAFKKLAQDIFAKFSLTQGEYQKLIKNNFKYSPEKDDKNLTYNKAIEFNENGAKIKNNLFGLLADNIETYKKEYEFEHSFENEQIISKLNKIKYNQNILTTYKAYFNDGKRFSNDELIDIIENIAQFLGISKDSFLNTFDYLKNSISNSSQKKIVIDFVNALLNNETLNKTFNNINKDVDVLFATNNDKNINLKNVVNTIFKTLLSKESFYKQVSSFASSDFVKNEENKKWLIDLLDTAAIDLIDSKYIIKGLFNKEIAVKIERFFKDESFKTAAKAFAKKIITLIFDKPNIAKQTKSFEDLISTLLIESKDELNVLIDEIAKQLKANPNILDEITNNVVERFNKKFHFDANDKENIKYMFSNLLSSFNEVKNKDKFAMLILNALFKSEKTNENYVDDVFERVIYGLLNPASLNSVGNKNHELLFEILGFIPTNIDNKEKYVSGIKAFVFSYLKSNIKAANFTFEEFRKNLLKLTQNLLANNDNAVNSQTKEIILDAINKMLDNFLEYKSLFYDVIKNLSGFLVFQKITNYLDKNNLSSLVLAENPQYKNIEEFTEAMFKNSYDILNNEIFANSLKQMFKHIINNSENYKFDNIAQFVNKILANGNENNLKNVISSIFQKTSQNVELTNQLASIFKVWLKKETNTTLTNEELNKIKNYVAELILNVPNSELFTKLFENVVKKAKELDSKTQYDFKDMSDAFKDIFSDNFLLNNNPQIIQQAIDLIFAKPYLKKSIWETQDVLKVFATLLCKESFINYIFDKVDVKKRIFDYIDKLDIASLKLSSATSEELKSLIDDFKTFVSDSWDTNFAQKIKSLIVKSFSDEVINKTKSLEDFAINVIQNTKNIILEMINSIFDNFLLDTKNEKQLQKFSKLIVDIAQEKIPNFVILEEDKNAITNLISKLIKQVRNHKVFENVIDEFVKNICDSIKQNGFDFSKINLSKLFSPSILMSLISFENLNKILEDEITSSEILSLARTLLRNLNGIITLAIPKNAENKATKNNESPNYSKEIYSLIRVIFGKLVNDDKKLLINELIEAIKKLQDSPLTKLIDDYLTGILNKFDKNLLDEVLIKSNTKSIEEFTSSLRKDIWDNIFKDENISLIKSIFENIFVENFSLYNVNNLGEFLTKVIKLSKTNKIYDLLNKILKGTFENENFVVKISHFALAYIKQTTKIELSNDEYNKLFDYLKNVILHSTNSSLINNLFTKILNEFDTLPTNITLDKIGSKTIETILKHISSKDGLNEILDILLVKNNVQNSYTIEQFTSILKILFDKPNFVDYILQKANVKNLIVNSIANINLDPLRFGKNCVDIMKEITNKFGNYIDSIYDAKIVPLFKQIVTNLLSETTTKNVQTLTDWIANAIENSQNNVASTLDSLLTDFINNSSDSEFVKQKIASFLIELTDHDLINVEWPENGKQLLTSAIAKLITAIPKLNIFKSIMSSSFKNIAKNIRENSFDINKWDISTLINIPSLLNGLNLDELNGFINKLTSKEISSIMLMLLNNIESFSNLLKSSPQQKNIVSWEGKISLDLDKLFTVLKSWFSILNNEDKVLVKAALPKLYHWFRNESKMKALVSENLEFIKTKLLEINPKATDFANLVFNKVISTIFDLDSTEKFFNALLTSLISLDEVTFNSLNNFNGLFKYLIETNKVQIKEFVKDFIKSIISDSNFLDKALQFTFDEINKKFNITTTSANINSIISLLKRVILKVNNLNLVSQITDDLIDLIADLKLFDDSNHINGEKIKEAFVEKLKKVDYAKYLSTQNMSELIETILDKNLPIATLKGELLSVYYYIVNNLSKFNTKTKPASIAENEITSEQVEWLKTVEKLIFNLLSAANGAIKPNNINAKEALIEFLFEVAKDQVSKIDFDSLKLELVSNEKLKWIVSKIIKYDEIKNLIRAIVEDYLSGPKITNVNNLGSLISEIIKRIQNNLQSNITSVITKFAKDDEVLTEVIEQVINLLSLENVTTEDRTFLKDLASKFILELLNTELYTRKTLKRTITQFSNYAKQFDILNPKKFIIDAINKITSAFGGGDAAILANYIGENKIINGPTLVKLINLVFGKAKHPTSLVYDMLRNINYSANVNERTNMTTLNNMVNLDMLNPKKKGDPNDPDNITVTIDPLTTLDNIFKLLGSEVNKEANNVANYNSKYVVRSKQPAYQATYRLLTTMNLAVFEMFGRETLNARRDNNGKLNLYSGVRSILWELQEGTNLKWIPIIAGKFSGMQRYFGNANIRREFSNYIISKGFIGGYKYYDESNYGPDSIMYLTVTSGYNEKEKGLLKPFKFKVKENGNINEVSKKEYILMTIKAGGFGHFMKLNNAKSISKWSGLNKNTEWE